MGGEANRRGSKLKGLHELTDEELLKALDNADKQSNDAEDLPQSTDIPHFLSFFNIRPGDNKVLAKAIFQLYKAWSKTPEDFNKFCRVMPLYVESKLGTYSRTYYLIDKTAFAISGEIEKILLSNTVDKRTSVRYRQHFESFLKARDITSGKIWINMDIVFYLYDLWVVKRYKRNPIGRAEFTKMCKVYFESKRTWNKDTWIRLSASIYNHITKEKITELEGYWKALDAKKRKEARIKRIKKKQKSLSKLGPNPKPEDPV
jgi:hypothetical protein